MRRTCPVAAAALLVSACADVPPPDLGPAYVPAQFQQATGNAPLWPSATWWREFGDPQLSELMARAQASNLDLYQAAARVRQADARARQAGAVLLPAVGLSTSATSFYGRSGGASLSETDYGAALGITYELDFWGKNRNKLQSADAARTASRADRATVALTVTAGVATTYIQLLAVQDRISIARANLASSRAILTVVQRRVNAGYAAPADLTQQEVSVAASEAVIPVLEQEALEARSSLAILLGVPPENFDIRPAQLADIKIPVVQPGLPSQLLTRRPDIAGAEANLIGAHADLAAARKAYLPDITLTASGGAAYPALAAAVQTLPGFGLAANGAAALTQVIFDNGRIRAMTDEARAREDELLGAYRAAVISSFSEVETALGNVAHLATQQAALDAQVVAAEKVLVAAQRKYTAGSADFLVVVDAQRSLYSAREQLADNRRAHLLAIVDLFKALGGGWREPDGG